MHLYIKALVSNAALFKRRCGSDQRETGSETYTALKSSLMNSLSFKIPVLEGASWGSRLSLLHLAVSTFLVPPSSLPGASPFPSVTMLLPYYTRQFPAPKALPKPAYANPS